MWRQPSGGNHHCDGTNNGANSLPGPTCTSILNELSKLSLNPFTFDGYVQLFYTAKRWLLIPLSGIVIVIFYRIWWFLLHFHRQGQSDSEPILGYTRQFRVHSSWGLPTRSQCEWWNLICVRCFWCQRFLKTHWSGNHISWSSGNPHCGRQDRL